MDDHGVVRSGVTSTVPAVWMVPGRHHGDRGNQHDHGVDMTHVETVGARAVHAPAAAPRPTGTVAAVLDGCRSLDVLRDRLVPGRRGLLDWLVVSRSAVYVVDEYDGGQARPVVRARQGGVRNRPEAWTLVVDGQDHPHALPGLRGRSEVVREVLAEAGWTDGGLVVPVLCIDGARLPALRHQLRIGSCLVVGTRGLSRLVGSGGHLAAEARSRITAVLLDSFPARPRA